MVGFDIVTSKSKAPETQVSVDERIEGLKSDSKAQTRKERLSAYFTIAAAAFGLISDGCESSSKMTLLPRRA